ncbi:MAG: hypothetical protein LBS27_00420 [Bifidobacteriaceae bacterium]|nr:hypothetical protein [Bifidobacteriaceae bacterium]
MSAARLVAESGRAIWSRPAWAVAAIALAVCVGLFVGDQVVRDSRAMADRARALAAPEPVKLIETFWLEAFCWWLFVVVLAG